MYVYFEKFKWREELLFFPGQKMFVMFVYLNWVLLFGGKLYKRFIISCITRLSIIFRLRRCDWLIIERTQCNFVNKVKVDNAAAQVRVEFFPLDETFTAKRQTHTLTLSIILFLSSYHSLPHFFTFPLSFSLCLNE